MTAPRCNAGCEEMPPKYPSQPNRTPPWATGYVNNEQNKLALIGGAKMFELDCVVFCFFSLVKGEHVLLCGTFSIDHSCACWSIKTAMNTSVMSDFHTTTANCSACNMPFFHVAKMEQGDQCNMLPAQVNASRKGVSFFFIVCPFDTNDIEWDDSEYKEKLTFT